ncbi:MAG: hypothetical protein VX184_00985 [Candidatus Thermoplasmatota archaeon]|nr:hypothetical protein [Candidatus Thermoplasmatota archaeon]
MVFICATDMTSTPASMPVMLDIEVDRSLLDILYRGRLMELRDRAESEGLSKGGSVEVLRARLIQHLVLGEMDLTWEGIHSLTHKEAGTVLKVFGIKSSGSHKERRQRLWLHLNFDSRRLSVENLADMERDELHELCLRLELPLTGTRTVLMGHVAGVLTSQGRGWGRIKRSLWRSGIPDATVDVPKAEVIEEVEEIIKIEATNQESFGRASPVAVLEDARDLIVKDADKSNPAVQGALLTIASRVEELERMVGSILRGHSGTWGSSEEGLLIRLAGRRGWPLESDEVCSIVVSVATNIAESKGASIGEGVRARVDAAATMSRVRKRMEYAETLFEGD